MTESKATNPKDALGVDKLPLHLVPQSPIALVSLALADGALKYGSFNWRVAGVRASVYYDALMRHVWKWFSGEEKDPDSGLPHLAHALANLFILVDAQACGKLNDDRAYPAELDAYIASLTPHVARLKRMHADRHPKHYTIEDSPQPQGGDHAQPDHDGDALRSPAARDALLGVASLRCFGFCGCGDPGCRICSGVAPGAGS